MENIFKVNNLKKSFKEKNVLKGISFNVDRGEILCFLGLNGAGKSTNINIFGRLGVSSQLMAIEVLAWLIELFVLYSFLLKKYTCDYIIKINRI